jgi:hypothetical protein
MHTISVAALMAASGCRRTPDTAPAPMSTAPQIRASGAGPNVRHAEDFPNLGPDFVPARLVPGRFSSAVQKTNLFVHAEQVVREDLTSSFVLKMETDGSATVCRGWRWLFNNDGPEVHSREHLREQLGYRGRWEKKGDWAELDLELDDGVCPNVAEYSHMVPNHATRWQLRCVAAFAPGHPAITVPLLVCRLGDGEPAFGEDAPHVVDGVADSRFIPLGGGNGLRIRLDKKGRDEPSRLVVTTSDDLVQPNSWQKSF